MAYRIHVIGSYKADQAEFQSALNAINENANSSGPSPFRFGSSGNWQWANASVWHVNGAEIDQAISTLSTPAIRVTSSDGVLWTITVTQGKSSLFRGVHFFTSVGEPSSDTDEYDDEEEYFDDEFPEDEIDEVAGINRYEPKLEFLWDEEEEARIRALDEEDEEENVNPVVEEYRDYGVTLPKRVIEQFELQSNQQAYRTAFEAHSEQIVDALANADLEFDRNEMLKLLTVGPLTEMEQDSDLGNMQRFVEALGIMGLFAEMPDEPEENDIDDEEAAPPKCWSEFPTEELYEKARLCLNNSMIDIDNRPFEIALTDILHLHRLSYFCGGRDESTVVLSIELDDESLIDCNVWYTNTYGLEAIREGNTWHICFSPNGWWYFVESQSTFVNHSFLECLRTIPNDARVTFTFLIGNQIQECHRYSTVKHQDNFQILQTYPVFTKEELVQTLKHMDLIIGNEPIPLLNEQEEERVRSDYKRSQGERPKIRNGKVKPEIGSRECIVKTLFFERFRDVPGWDIPAAKKREEADWQYYDSVVNGTDEQDESNEQEADSEEFRDKVVEEYELHEAAMVVPHSHLVIHEGKSGKIYQASMTDLKHLDKKQLENEDAILKSMGFARIADMASESEKLQSINRCYFHPQAFGLLAYRQEGNESAFLNEGNYSTLIDFSEGNREFRTHFKDGSTLVTSNVQCIESKPKIKLFVRMYEEYEGGDEWPALWRKHLDGIQRMEMHRKTRPIDHTQYSSPQEFAKREDTFIHKIMKHLQ